MGTSAARRGPQGRRWSYARRAATRYLAGEASGPAAAREVAARYVAALDDTAASAGRDLLGAFALTRRAAQNLGEFWEEARSRGWEQALADRGVQGGGSLPGQGAALSAAAALGGREGSLEAAVARTALVRVVEEGFAGAAPPLEDDAAHAVSRFLAAALYLSLVLDLGETLEAAGRDAAHLSRALAGLKDAVDKGLGRLPAPESPHPQEWRGLAGWVRVTRLLKDLLEGIRGQAGTGHRT